MAILKGGIFGDISGKLNNVVVRKVRGKDVVTVRPKKYKKTKSKKAKYVRSRFSIAVEWAKYINSIPILKEVWSYADIKGSSAFNKIEKYNIKQVDDNAPSLKNIITPHEQPNTSICSFPIEDISLNSQDIVCKLKDKNLNYPSDKDYNYTLVLILLFYEPKRKDKRYFIMENITHPPLDLSSIENEIKIQLTASINNNFKLYKRMIIYAASIITVVEKKKYFSSLTFTKEFDIK